MKLFYKEGRNSFRCEFPCHCYEECGDTVVNNIKIVFNKRGYDLALPARRRSKGVQSQPLSYPHLVDAETPVVCA
jgi:hypothetical protein